MTIRIVSRAEWGARPPRSITRTTWTRRVGVAVHYSGGSPTNTPRDLQNYAMDMLHYSDTHYNFFVDRAGVAYEGRGWLVIGGHAANQNTEWIGACFIGRDPDVTDAAKATLRALYDEGCRLSGKTLRYSGHGQLPGQNTDCPGANLRAWIAAGMPYPDSQTDMEENMGLLVAHLDRPEEVWFADGMYRRLLTPAEAQQMRTAHQLGQIRLSGDATVWTTDHLDGYGLVPRVELSDEQLPLLADLIAARMPVPPTAEQIAEAVADEDHRRSAG